MSNQPDSEWCGRSNQDHHDQLAKQTSPQSFADAVDDFGGAGGCESFEAELGCPAR
jgi:hypothetical protein